MNFLKWLDNFWYHNKWKTIVSLFVVVVLSICVFQLATKKKYDACIMYVGAKSAGIEQSIEKEIATLIGDGKPKVNFSRLAYDPDNNLAAEANITAQEQLSHMLVMPYYIYIMDKEVYEIYKDSPVFATLEDIYGSDIPDFAYDNTALVYSKTLFARSHESDNAIPDDAVIVLKVKPYIWGKRANSKEQKNYETHKELFKKIVGE
ncbi:MAG: hypothetical protein PUJ72_00095 [Eubacteriales bacterium]|nr:hypothetical protein [Eubacteriales bacterium]